MHSKRFADEAGRLHWYDTNEPRRGIQYVTPQGAFWKWRQYVEERPVLGEDGYPLTGASGSEETIRTDATEIYLAEKVENPTSLLLDRIVGPVQAGSLPPISEDERLLLQRYWLHQYVRGPGSLARVMPPEDREAFFDEMQRLTAAARGGALLDSERLLLETPSRREQMMKNAYVRAVRAPGEEGLKLLRSCGLFYIVAPPDVPFVVASDPVVLLGDPEKRMLGDGIAMGILPISSQVAMCFGARDSGGTISQVQNPDDIFSFNRMAVEQSDSFASGLRCVTESLVPYAQKPVFSASEELGSDDQDKGL